jgi:hypothetical protein
VHKPDWEIIHREFERGAEELKELHGRRYHRKEPRAARNKHIVFTPGVWVLDHIEERPIELYGDITRPDAHESSV